MSLSRFFAYALVTAGWLMLILCGLCTSAGVFAGLVLGGGVLTVLLALAFGMLPMLAGYRLVVVGRSKMKPPAPEGRPPIAADDNAPAPPGA